MRYFRVGALLLICALSLSQYGWAQGPAQLYGLFNTGVDDQERALLDDDVDPHYTLVEPSLVVGDSIVATSAGAAWSATTSR